MTIPYYSFPLKLRLARYKSILNINFICVDNPRIIGVQHFRGGVIMGRKPENQKPRISEGESGDEVTTLNAQYSVLSLNSHKSSIMHEPHLGFLAIQVYRPCKINQ